MRFLANENFPFPSIAILRDSGFYVKSISEERKGISDLEVIKVAIDEDLTILTFDKDYGEIIFKSGYAKPPSVIFFRHKGENPQFAGEHIVKLLIKEMRELSNSFTVIEQENYRQRVYK